MYKNKSKEINLMKKAFLRLVTKKGCCQNWCKFSLSLNSKMFLISTIYIGQATQITTGTQEAFTVGNSLKVTSLTLGIRLSCCKCLKGNLNRFTVKLPLQIPYILLRPWWQMSELLHVSLVEYLSCLYGAIIAILSLNTGN